jgi:hypothetical protein
VSASVVLRGTVKRLSGKAVLFQVALSCTQEISASAGITAWFPFWCTSLRRKDGWAFLTVPRDLLLKKIAEAERQSEKRNDSKNESWVP